MDDIEVENQELLNNLRTSISELNKRKTNRSFKTKKTFRINGYLCSSNNNKVKVQIKCLYIFKF